MIDSIDRDGVQRLVRQERAQVVEVLPRPEYDWAHLPDAVNLPLKQLGAESTATLDRSRPVIVYCHNTECDMSPRAAVRLRRLGFARVYDYPAGKMDWLSYGLPHEGEALLVGDVISRDAPTCRLDERLVDIRRRFDEPDLCVVLDDGVVQGVLRGQVLRHPPDQATAAQAMTVGPTTVRPSEEVEALTARMRHHHVNAIPVTGSDGRLLGILLREEAESALTRHRQGTAEPVRA
ncbi:CBS domain-containing protein [Micromonospora yasonensis]|uniref:CBS domain-containing protein n=1 Tax=Micromonospora yasonensis TaxID=1128667 RepID=UPI00222FE36B|nr:CBS domain-containing protein [Micromonospora yasonensis]MCW3841194.1 CBS domain-containing protein [Micromonospora yasonensis]